MLYYFTSNDLIEFLGYAYLFTAIIINLITFLLLLILAIRYKSERKLLFRTAGLLLINLPIALVYLGFVDVLDNTMRINLKNSTAQELRAISITGCEDYHFDQLKPGESRTVWIRLSGGCTIYLSYYLNGQINRRVVKEIDTRGQGQKLIYEIWSGEEGKRVVAKG